MTRVTVCILVGAPIRKYGDKTSSPTRGVVHYVGCDCVSHAVQLCMCKHMMGGLELKCFTVEEMDPAYFQSPTMSLGGYTTPPAVAKRAHACLAAGRRRAGEGLCTGGQARAQGRAAGLNQGQRGSEAE